MSWESYGDEKILRYHMLEIDILGNSSQKQFQCPEWYCIRIWISKSWPDALLARTMVRGETGLTTCGQPPSIYNIACR